MHLQELQELETTSSQVSGSGINMNTGKVSGNLWCTTRIFPSWVVPHFAAVQASTHSCTLRTDSMNLRPILDWEWMTAAFISIIPPWHHFLSSLRSPQSGSCRALLVLGLSGHLLGFFCCWWWWSVSELFRASNWDVFVFICPSDISEMESYHSFSPPEERRSRQSDLSSHSSNERDTPR